MANPTTAKPTTAIYGSGLTFGTNLQSLIAMTEGVGAPADCKNLVVAQPTFAVGAGGGNGFANNFLAPHVGGPPVWVSNGLAGFGYTLKFDHSTRPLFFGACGFATSTSNGATVARTIACVFKHNITSYNRTSNAKVSYSLVQSGNGGGTGLALTADSLGSISPADKVRLIYTSGNSITDPNIPMEIVAGRWYAAAVSISTISGGNTTKTFYLYDITNQRLHPASGQTMVDAFNGFIDSNLLTVAAYGQDIQTNQFVGEFAAISLHNEGWNSSSFDSYYADPIAPGRGTYSAAGSLTAGVGRYYDSDPTSITISFPRTTGTGTGGGTGSPTYSAYRSTLSTNAPGAGDSTLVSGAVVATGVNVVNITDTTVTAGQGFFYTLRSVDGSQTVDSVAVYGRAKSKATMKVGVIGDSKEQLTGVINFTAAAALADNRKLVIADWARGAAGLTANNAVTSWRIGNVIPAANQACTIAYRNGSVTGGTFNLIFPFNTPITVSGIAWNTSVAALQGLIDTALGGANLIVVSGAGALNSNTLTLTGGSSGAYNNTAWPLPVFDLAGSALTGATPTTAGVPVTVGATQTIAACPGTTANSLYTQALAEFSRVGVTAVILQNAANDTANSTWGTALSAQIADLLSRGYTPLVRYPHTRRSSAILSNNADPTTDNTYAAFIPYITAAVAANTGCKLGSETNWANSAQECNTNIFSDGVHEVNNGFFAASVGFSQYRELVDAFEPTSSSSYPAPFIGG